MQNLVALAQIWAYGTAARPVFVAMMKGYVTIILNHMFTCFRSKNWSFVLGTGIRMGVYVRNLVVSGFYWTAGSNGGPNPFLRHMSFHLTVWWSKGPCNRPYFIWLSSNQIGCEQPDLVHEEIPASSYKTCFREWQIAPNLIEKAPLQFLSTLTAKGASFGVKTAVLMLFCHP